VILSPVGKCFNQLDNNGARAVPVWYADHMFVLSLCAESLRESYCDEGSSTGNIRVSVSPRLL
jgi:hypothetical protein